MRVLAFLLLFLMPVTAFAHGGAGGLPAGQPISSTKTTLIEVRLIAAEYTAIPAGRCCFKTGKPALIGLSCNPETPPIPAQLILQDADRANPLAVRNCGSQSSIDPERFLRPPIA